MSESRETIGQRLRQLRLSRKITIEAAAEATHIRVPFLQALEADNYSAMSSSAQGRGFLRMYASYLGLDLETAMQELREGGPVVVPVEPAEAVKETPVSAQAVDLSSGEEKSSAKPFWTRLLKRPAPEIIQPVETPPVPEAKVSAEPLPSAVEAAPAVVEPVLQPAGKKKESKSKRLKS